MKNLLIVFVLLIFSVSDVFAYAVKVYDQMGNRIGTYKKEGDNYVLYDFNDKKVENPEDLIKNPPDKKTLTEYSQYFYNANRMPIGYFNNGILYPYRRCVPRCFCPTNTPSIIRQKNTTIYEERYPYGRVKSVVK